MGAAWRIARKDLVLRMRDRSAFILGVGVPLILAFVFNLVFGGAFGGDSITTLAYADADGGDVATGLGAALQSMSDDGVVTLLTAPDEEALTALVDEGEAEAGILVPAGLSEAVAAGQGAEVTIIGDVDSPIAESIARAVAAQFAARIADSQRGVAAAMSLGAVSPEDSSGLAASLFSAPPVVTVGEVAAASRVLEPTTFFAVSMAVFFVFFMVQFGVTGLLDEEREGTLTRLRSAPIPRGAVVVGKVITSIVLGVVSLVILWITTSLLMGAEWGPPLGVLILILAVVLAATSIIGVVAGVANTPEGAGNAGSVIAVVLGMLGGTFFPIAGGNRVLEILSLATPHAWFLRGVGALHGDGSLASIVPAVVALLVFALAMGLVAALILRRKYR